MDRIAISMAEFEEIIKNDYIYVDDFDITRQEVLKYDNSIKTNTYWY